MGKQLREVLRQNGYISGAIPQCGQVDGENVQPVEEIVPECLLLYRIREIGNDRDGVDELNLLKQWLDLGTQVAALKKQVKDAEAALDKLAFETYPMLAVADVKSLVVDDKWMTRLAASVQGELDRVSQTLTGRIRELAERYATPLPKLTGEVATLAARVEGHLLKMGALWM